MRIRSSFVIIIINNVINHKTIFNDRYCQHVGLLMNHELTKHNAIKC